MTAAPLRLLPAPDCEAPLEVGPLPPPPRPGDGVQGVLRLVLPDGELPDESLLDDAARSDPVGRSWADDHRDPRGLGPGGAADGPRASPGAAGGPVRRADDDAGDEADAQGADTSATGETDGSRLPPPRLWGRQVVQVLLEVLDGHRPRAQLLRWVTPEVYEQVGRRARLRRRSDPTGRPRPRIGGVLACTPADGVAEVCAVVHGPAHVSAVALRLEGCEDRWRVTVLELG
ncbi:Rv3235 family protein [Angustibacter aerolatus]